MDSEQAAVTSAADVTENFGAGDNDVVTNKINIDLQKLEEKAKKAEEALAAEEKVRKELEVLNAKLLAEKTALLDSLAGEKGSLQEFQEKTAKLNAQKNDLDNQLRVSTPIIVFPFYKRTTENTHIDLYMEFDLFLFSGKMSANNRRKKNKVKIPDS